MGRGTVLHNPLIRKLDHGAHLTETERGRLARITARTRQVGPRQDIVREGDAPDVVRLVLDGMACRYKSLSNGGRSIVALLLPGDFCDLHVAVLGEMDHAIATFTPCTVAEIPRATIDELTGRHPNIARALWWATLVDEGVLREWLINMSTRRAEQRTAHLFCELLVRLRAVGLADEDGYDLSLTQQELADVLALSTVHMNRTLQSLREHDLIVLRDRRLTIPNVARLSAYAEFKPGYLRLAS